MAWPLPRASAAQRAGEPQDLVLACSPTASLRALAAASSCCGALASVEYQRRLEHVYLDNEEGIRLGWLHLSRLFIWEDVEDLEARIMLRVRRWDAILALEGFQWNVQQRHAATLRLQPGQVRFVV